MDEPFCPGCGESPPVDAHTCDNCGYECHESAFPTVRGCMRGDEDGSRYGDVDLGMVVKLIVVKWVLREQGEGEG
jgi:hypothetical protein